MLICELPTQFIGRKGSAEVSINQISQGLPEQMKKKKRNSYIYWKGSETLGDLNDTGIPDSGV